jgi:hypothetical protein
MRTPLRPPTCTLRSCASDRSCRDTVRNHQHKEASEDGVHVPA